MVIIWVWHWMLQHLQTIQDPLCVDKLSSSLDKLYFSFEWQTATIYKANLTTVFNLYWSEARSKTSLWGCCTCSCKGKVSIKNNMLWHYVLQAVSLRQAVEVQFIPSVPCTSCRLFSPKRFQNAPHSFLQFYDPCKNSSNKNKLSMLIIGFSNNELPAAMENCAWAPVPCCVAFIWSVFEF